MGHARSEQGRRMNRAGAWPGPVREPGQCGSPPWSGKPAMPFQASDVSSCTAVSLGTLLSDDSQ